MNNSEAIDALGLKREVTYHVVPVRCMEKDCVYNPDCQDNAVGLTDTDKGQFMDCHDYKTAIWQRGKTKRVFWERA